MVSLTIIKKEYKVNFILLTFQKIRFCREERCYVNGRLDGPAKYIYSKSGAEENRIYEAGVLQGRAVKQTPSGECEERNYERGILEGEVSRHDVTTCSHLNPTLILDSESKYVRYVHYILRF